MVRIIKTPRIIPAAGTPPKQIEEYIGNEVSRTPGVSIARMVSPAGWSEPEQKPEFDEYTLVIRGTLELETDRGHFVVAAGQACIIPRGTGVRYSTPEGAEYIAVCIPAFSPGLVHRGEAGTRDQDRDVSPQQAGYTIRSCGSGELDDIRDIWTLLRDHIAACSEHFSGRIKEREFEERKQDILRRNAGRVIRTFIASRRDSSEDVGYCICSAARRSYGEIESIFVREEYRNQGIGTDLMNHAISWITEMDITDLHVHVTVGNETTLPFYKKFGLYPRQYLLSKPDEP
ncbi:MAG: GNAT family N-acetyltransferase [Methanospirillum sp.]|nr:GNAT family N-acetyltransferase [Methanospirillum sp.]